MIVVLAEHRAIPMTSEKWVAVGVGLKVIWELSDNGVLRGILSSLPGRRRYFLYKAFRPIPSPETE